MGCLYLIVALISPRILLVVLWIFTEYINTAFTHWIWPLLGLFFAPYLTLALTWGYNTEFGPFQIAAVVIGALMDFGSYGETERRRRARST